MCIGRIRLGGPVNGRSISVFAFKGRNQHSTVGLENATFRLMSRALLLGLCACAQVVLGADPALPKLEEVVAARRDLWGEAAMGRPNGASYEFFEKLLPPPRYVKGDFRYYPLVLTAPRARVKARLISNGSGVNLRGGTRSWHDVGIPMTFRVGPDELRFGDLADRLSDPVLAEGYLPIYQIDYRHPYPVQAEGFVPINQKKAQREAEVYRLEAFAGTTSALAEQAAVFVKFSLGAGSNGIVSIDPEPGSKLVFKEGRLTDERGLVHAIFDAQWKWERDGARAKVTRGVAPTAVLFTRPLEAGAAFAMTAAEYQLQREEAGKTWKDLLKGAMLVEVPEERVNLAWRNLLLQNFGLINGERLLYSAGNQYQAMYEAEGSDAARGLMSWGYEAEARKLIVSLLNFTRKGLEYHHTGIKLNDIARYYWQTRDPEFVKTARPKWEKELRLVLDSRTNAFGLLPKEQYCGDIKTPVFALSVNAKAWRALVDMAQVLGELGEEELARTVTAEATTFRKALDAALEKSIHRETTPPFFPNALLADETVHDPITSVRIGSYWNLMVNYSIGSRLYPTGSEQDSWMPHYVEQHGGICMGMTRSGATAHGFWTGPDRVNPLYGTRYVLDTLRRDEPERALVSFYGMLAQGFTRNTLVVGEGCTLAPVDAGGRMFYLPPNSSGNAHFLRMLRELLVQDQDLDGDGRPETLRLLFGTSRRWLEEGKSIRIERAPTAFGPVSVEAQSHLKDGRVEGRVQLPARNEAKATLLRVRLPEGWQATSAQVGERQIKVDERGTLDLTGLKGEQKFSVKVRPAGK
jgi:hypothetical protein